MSNFEDIFSKTKTIAMVGLSDKPNRPSYGVAEYLQFEGFRIVPVNPLVEHDILGEKCYAKLSDIPFPVDMVDVFRKSEDCLEVAHDAVAIGAKILWLQLGVTNDEAKEVAEQNGLICVMDRCTKIELQNL